MGDPAPKLPAPDPDPFTPEERAEADRLAAHLAALGIPVDDLATPTDVTTDEVHDWLQGRATCPWPR